MTWFSTNIAATQVGSYMNANHSQRMPRNFSVAYNGTAGSVVIVFEN